MDNILLSVVDLKCNDSQSYQLLDGGKFRETSYVLKQSCVQKSITTVISVNVCVFTQVIYMGVVLYAPALALNAGN